MLIGHLGFAMALKARAGKDGPGFGLAPWFGAVLFSDLMCFPLTLIGVETFRFDLGFTRNFPYRILSAPYTHSFLGDALLGIAVGLVWWLARGRAPRLLLAAAAIAVGIFSHAPFDWVVHGPDMAWAFEPPALGLSLWNHPEISNTLEVLLLSAGTCILLAEYPGLLHWRFKTMLGILLVAQFVPSFAPPVANTTIAAIAGFSSMFGLTLLGWWGGRIPALSSASESSSSKLKAAPLA
jgi:hypothetical protein